MGRESAVQVFQQLSVILEDYNNGSLGVIVLINDLIVVNAIQWTAFSVMIVYEVGYPVPMLQPPTGT